MRQLNYAINDKGEKIQIDSLNITDKNSNKLFFCPRCKKQVIPRLGDEIAWHFAHKDKECFVESVEYKKATHKSLDEFKTSDGIIEIKTPSNLLDNPFYQCPMCKKEQKKEYGVKVSDDTYFCRHCYSQSTPTDLAKYF